LATHTAGRTAATRHGHASNACWPGGPTRKGRRALAVDGPIAYPWTMRLEVPPADVVAVAPATRSPLRAVAVPSEHGGWGLTLEPALLGLLIAPSGPGAALAAAAFLAFLVRTPLKLALVDRRRHRRLDRTALAEKVAAVELLTLSVLAVLVVASAASGWWVPVVLAVPLVGTELWFDVRSRSRRLVPELTGAIGIGSVAAAIVLADGGRPALAAAVWCVLAARAVAAIPFVRGRIAALHGRVGDGSFVGAGFVAATALAAVAVVLDRAALAGAVVVGVVMGLQVLSTRRPAPRAAVVGIQQMVLGLAVVGATAVGVLAA
jgi:hypothetical protein